MNVKSAAFFQLRLELPNPTQSFYWRRGANVIQ
jgi:hypothetical protein